MTHILVVGIGGIGGFFGGKLAKSFEKDENVHIHFLARGATKDIIQQNGIAVKSDTESFSAFPTTIADTAIYLDKMDYIILCTKSYDLEETIHAITPCIDDQTILIPLLNGVDSRGRIQGIFPQNLVTDGCANIIARRTAPGQVEVFSTFRTLHFGAQGVNDDRLDRLQQLLLTAGIDATLTENIWKDIWTKFIFISSAATITSYFDRSFGQIRDTPHLWEIYDQLLDEIQQLAQAKEIELPANIKEKAKEMFHNAPAEATTSMHTDFRSNSGKNELEALSGYIVKETVQHGVHAATYKKMYDYLSNPEMSTTYQGIFSINKKL